MPLWQWVIDSFGVLIALIVLLVIALVIRRRVLARKGGTFELSVNIRFARNKTDSPRGWVLGIGRYSGDRLEWYRVFSISVRPKYVFDRAKMDVIARHDPHGPETFALYAGHVIVDCKTADGKVRFGLSPEALTGMLAWLESAPPGGNSNNVL